MSNFAPYLVRRGDTLFFRISVPEDLRLQLGIREITKTLRTPNKQKASPIALSLAAQAKQLFNKLRGNMGTGKSNDKDIKIDLIYRLELNELGLVKSLEITTEPDDKVGEAEALIQATLAGIPKQQSSKILTPATNASNTSICFHEIVDTFLAEYPKNQHPEMFKKHCTALPLLREFIGNIPASEIRQRHIKEFFALLQKLPPRWADIRRKDKLSIQALAAQNHEITIAPKTFNSTYKASIRPFIEDAITTWQDSGFPATISLKSINYNGDRVAGEKKQRAFTPSELKRLFEGDEYKSFAENQSYSHFYWLPLIALFTGARVNEICQLNPQVDIFKDSESNTWCFGIDSDTESDSRIDKSVKTENARKVPIHKQILKLGFLDYVERIKSTGARLLFPEWLPVNRRASGNAEDWFRQFLVEINLRDETPHKCILGMHAFRHTLLTYGARQEPAIFLMCITGHEQDEAVNQVTGAAKGYFTLSLLSPLQDRAALLNKLEYEINFPIPKK